MIIKSGINITSAFVIIFAESLLVMYSSSIFNISSLLLNFNKYLFINGILEYVKYNFITDEIIKEIIIYLESSLSEIDNINNYILELESKINELEQSTLF